MISLRCLVPAAIALSMTHAPAAHAIGGDPELLKLVGDARGANLAKIHSWVGHALLDEMHSSRVSGRGASGSHSRAEFAIDRDNNAARWALVKVDTYEAGLPPLPCAHPEVNAALLVDDRFYRSTPAIMETPDVLTNALIVFPRKKQHVSNFVVDFDPMKFFSTANFDVGETLTFYYENRNDPRTDRPGTSVTREGDRVTLRVTSKEGDIVNDYVFDLAFGGNIVEQTNKSNTGESRDAWTYQQVDRVWLPASYEWFNVNRNEDGSEKDRLTRKVTFTDAEVNAVLPDSEFTPEKIGAVNGMSVTDHIHQGTYRYGETAITPFGTRGTLNHGN